MYNRWDALPECTGKCLTFVQIPHYKWCSIRIQDTDVGDIFLQEIGSADIGFQDPLSWQNMGGQYDVRKVWLFVRRIRLVQNEP